MKRARREHAGPPVWPFTTTGDCAPPIMAGFILDELMCWAIAGERLNR